MRYLAVLSTGLLMLAAAACGSSSSSPSYANIWLACTSDASCGSGMTCDTGDPNGQCFKTCASNADCTGLSKAAVCNAEGHCYASCTPTTAGSNTTSGNCSRAAEGYVCKADTGSTAYYCDGP